MLTVRGFFWLICCIPSIPGGMAQYTRQAQIGPDIGPDDYALGSTLFEDNFDTLDENTWTVEQYIPTSPDYEYVVYKKDKDVTFIKNGALCIKPKFIDDIQELKKEKLDVTNGCTRTEEKECTSPLFLIHKPIVSGRLVSKFNISNYVTIVVEAKLPLGDWIYPEIYLEGENNRRIYIAYSRGNAQLTVNDGRDLGGSLLFGGPVVANHTEPDRSRYLKYIRQGEPFSKKNHVYQLDLTPESIELFYGRYGFKDMALYRYGSINRTKFGYSNKEMFRLVIGVGVGGVSDFPDDTKSGHYSKPWKNLERNQVMNFYLNKDQWLPTWDEESRQLQIRYVGIHKLREWNL